VQVAQVNLDDRKVDLRFISGGSTDETVSEVESESESQSEESGEQKRPRRKRYYRKGKKSPAKSE